MADEHAVGFLEIHIEQGPVLEAEGLKVAAVTSIVGQTRLDLKFIGHANHAGTTPMHLRRDALAAAAEWITTVESLALNTEGLVATVGKLDVRPNAGNVIAGSAELSLDVRHVHDSPQNRCRRTARAGRSDSDAPWTKARMDKEDGRAIRTDGRTPDRLHDRLRSKRQAFPPKPCRAAPATTQ